MSPGGPKRLVSRLVWLPVLALALVAPAEAQLSLESSTVDGGGRTSSGGSLEVAGTIGQPDAGSTSGGSLDLESGFWTSENPAVPVELTSFEIVLGISSPRVREISAAKQTESRSRTPEARAGVPVSTAEPSDEQLVGLAARERCCRGE